MRLSFYYWHNVKEHTLHRHSSPLHVYPCVSLGTLLRFLKLRKNSHWLGKRGEETYCVCVRNHWLRRDHASSSGFVGEIQKVPDSQIGAKTCALCMSPYQASMQMFWVHYRVCAPLGLLCFLCCLLHKDRRREGTEVGRGSLYNCLLHGEASVGPWVCTTSVRGDRYVHVEPPVDHGQNFIILGDEERQNWRAHIVPAEIFNQSLQLFPQQ